ncbi:MAG: S-layer homology domain-containing protein [Chloroflexota bacterium]|nr:S-layer homology domain-containing protein [Chloroflexota bacterium]
MKSFGNLGILSRLVVTHKTPVSMLSVSVLALALLGLSRPVIAEQASPSAPEATCPAGGQCFADVPPGSPFYDYANNLYMQDIISGYPCGTTPAEPCDDQNRPYYRPASDVTRAQMTKFVDLARKQPGIHIDTTTHTRPLYVRTSAAVSSAIWAIAEGGSSTGVLAFSTNGNGVHGDSTTGIGVRGHSASGMAFYGDTTTSAGYAAYFFGRVQVQGNMTVTGNLRVSGTCTGCTGPSVIDHPLDPENKYLFHSAVESQDMMNIYNGNVTLDGKGEAVVQMPTWFEALNREFRYQLTAIGAPGPNLYVAEEIKNNHFKIAGGKAGMKVSWQVTGIRQDPYSEQHRTPVEVEKTQAERGLYLHPEAYGQPDSKQIGKPDLPQLPSNVEEPGTQP